MTLSPLRLSVLVLPCLGGVPAGFPSPAEDHLVQPLDLRDYLRVKEESAFFMRVSGCSMEAAGIHDGDVILVDRSLTPRQDDVVVAVVDGDLTVKRLDLEAQSLCPENPRYPPLPFGDASSVSVWGVVLAVVHRFRP
jgi:DNA polymerase V